MAPHDGGVVDQYVDRADFVYYPSVHVFDLIPFGNVAFVTAGHASRFSDDSYRFVGFRFVDVQARYFRAEIGESRREFAAQSPGGTGDLKRNNIILLDIGDDNNIIYSAPETSSSDIW